MSTWIRLDGFAATEIAAHTAPTWETLADGGCGEASWQFAASMRLQHQALRKGALVEIMLGPVPVYSGVLTEPDRTTGECHAFGLSSDLRRYIALAGGTTRDTAASITRAVTMGWRGSNPQPITGTAAGDATGNPIKVGELLDQYAEELGQRWGTDGRGRLYMRSDPTTPRWLATPDAAAFGVTDESAPTSLIGRYDTGAGYANTGNIGTPGLEDVVDLTDRGTMTIGDAQDILAGMLVRQGEVSWTNGATLHREQLTTFGGTPAGLASVRAGQMVRAHGFGYGAFGKAPWLDVVIGKTRYTAGDDVIYIEPTNTAPRTLAGVIAAA